MKRNKTHWKLYQLGRRRCRVRSFRKMNGIIEIERQTMKTTEEKIYIILLPKRETTNETNEIKSEEEKKKCRRYRNTKMWNMRNKKGSRHANQKPQTTFRWRNNTIYEKWPLRSRFVFSSPIHLLRSSVSFSFLSAMAARKLRVPFPYLNNKTSNAVHWCSEATENEAKQKIISSFAIFSFVVSFLLITRQTGKLKRNLATTDSAHKGRQCRLIRNGLCLLLRPFGDAVCEVMRHRRQLLLLFSAWNG